MSTSPARTWPVLNEHELVPYEAWNDWRPRSLLVLAPHPDDEVFGCGGLLALAQRSAWRTRVIVVTDGGQGGHAPTREAESLAAATALAGDGAPGDTEFWRLPDRGVVPDDKLRQRVESAVLEARADWVIAPSPFEVHPDHRAVCRVAIEALSNLQSLGHATRLVFCEIGQPLIANMLVDISAVAALKSLAAGCFASQLSVQPYHDQVAGLNRQRSYTLGPKVSHAEGYWCVDPVDLAGGVDGVLRGISRQLQRRL